MLGKSLGEVRSLPYAEFKRWYYFYLLEPWGWHDREARTSMLLTAVLRAGGNKKAKVEDFYRDMLEGIQREMQKQENGHAFDLETEEGRRSATAEMLKGFSGLFRRHK